MFLRRLNIWIKIKKNTYLYYGNNKYVSQFYYDFYNRKEYDKIWI